MLMNVSNHNTRYNVPEPDQDSADVGWSLSSPRMLTTSARFWFWPYNFGIRFSRKNISVNSKHITVTVIQQRTSEFVAAWWQCNRHNDFPGSVANSLWILTQNWVIFLQDMSISHSLLHVQWSSWQFSWPIPRDRFATTSRDGICFIHNKEYAFESGPSDRKQNGGAFFPATAGGVNWVECSGDVRLCAFSVWYWCWRP